MRKDGAAVKKQTQDPTALATGCVHLWPGYLCSEDWKSPCCWIWAGTNRGSTAEVRARPVLFLLFLDLVDPDTGAPAS